MKLARLFVHRQLGCHVVHVRLELGNRPGHPVGAAHPPDHGLLGEVAVLLGDGERAAGPLVGGHDRPRDAGVHPGDQLGVERPVRHAVGAGAVDAAVHPLDALDQAGRGLGVAEGRAQHVAERVAGPQQRLRAVGRLLVHPGHDRRVEHLHDDRRGTGEADARHVAVDLPRHAVGPTAQPGVAGGPAVDVDLVVSSADGLDLVDDPILQSHGSSMDLRVTGVNICRDGPPGLSVRRRR